MKKKLIQIFMLLVATISVGSFVSCKDTNEDLYNELRTQAISENAGLQEALDTQKAQLEALLAQFKTFQSCTCDKTLETRLQGQIDGLNTQVQGLLTRLGTLEADVDGLDIDDIDGLRDALNALQGEVNGTKVDVAGLTASFNSEIAGIKALIALLQTALNDKVDKATLDAIIGGLTTQIDGIKNGLQGLQDQNLLGLINTNKALQDGLEARIATLETQLANLKDYDDSDILTRLAKAEQAIIDNKAWFDQQIADLQGDVTKAQTTADNALALANTANTNAQLAFAEAQRIEGLANAAQAAADKAQTDATAAQQAAQAAQNAADLAYALAAQAAATANKVNDLAVEVATLTGRVAANEAAITKLQQDTKDLRDLIDANQDKLQAAIDKVNSDLTNKIDALKDDIQDKLDALKDNFQGKIDNLDGKLNDKVYELLSKISELRTLIDTNAGDIKTNAANIANNATNIKANADAIEKIQDELKTINNNLTLATEKANEAYKEASEAKAKAETNAQDISDLKVAVGANEAAIKNLEKTIDELKDAIKNLQDKAEQIGINTKAIENLTNAVNEVKDDLQDLSDKYDTLEDELDDLKTELAVAKAECAANLRDAKAYVDLEIANLKAAVAQQLADELNNYYDKDALNNILKGYATKEELTDKIMQLYKDMNAGDQAVGEKIYDLAQKVAANEQHLKDIDEVLKTMNENYVPRETIMAWLQDLYKTLNAKIGTGGADLDALKAYIDLVLPDLITKVLGGDEFNFIEKDELADLVKDLIDGKVDADDFADALQDLADLEARVKALEDGTVKIADYEVDKQALVDAIADANEKIGGLQDAVNTINGKLPTMENDIETLKSGLATAQGKLAEIEGRVNVLEGNVKDIQNYLGQQVTGITIQGTHNPMFGSFSIPANIQSNFLIAYYGKPATKVEFPTTDDMPYVRKEEVLTDADWNMINGDDIVFTQKANKTLMNEYVYEDESGATVRAANAGKVYVTVNPTSVDAKGLQLNIVNTQDEASLINLSPLKKSYATLEFGFSRANNGFYEADAYVKINDLDNVERPFDEQAIKDLAKVAKNEFKDIISGSLAPGSTGLDVLAVKVYDVVRSLRIDQSGLKCPFIAPDGQTEQAIYSQYNLAATAVKPVTLAFGKDFNYQTVPGYERAEKMLATIYDKLSGVVVSFNNNKEINNLFRDLEGLNIKHVTLNGLTPEFLAQFVIEIETSFTIDDVRYDLVLPVDVYVPVKYAEDLTTSATGAPLTIDAANAVDLSYFDDNIASNVKDALFNKIKTQVKKPTVVITNDDSGNLTSVLVVAVNDQSGKVQGFTQFPLETPVSLVSGEIQFNGTPIANVSSGSLVTIGTQNVNIDQLNYSFVFKGKTFEYKKTVDLSGAIASLWANVDEAIGDVNDILDKLNNLIDDALQLRDLIIRYEGKYTNAVENYFGVEGKLHGYLDKVNSVIVNFVNGINWQLGPFIVAEDTKGFKVMSSVKGATVMSKNNLRIYPTSKNLEILVPFARKHVAVTNVFKGSASAQGGDADCVAKLKAANTGDLNKVIDGTQRMIEVTGVESGYTYEFAYSVLDFNGNISTRKTYITIK